MNVFIRTVISGIALLVLVAGGSAAAQGVPLRGLSLTDAQREQVRQLTQQHREQTRALVAQMRAAQDARRQAVEAVPFNEAQLRAAMQQVAEAETELAVLQARLQSDIHALLTPEQQAQVAKMRADRQARLKQRLDRFQQRRQRQPRPQA